MINLLCGKTQFTTARRIWGRCREEVYSAEGAASTMVGREENCLDYRSTEVPDIYVADQNSKNESECAWLLADRLTVTTSEIEAPNDDKMPI
jgi:hypothetical protein